jgi:hypothetical protein
VSKELRVPGVGERRLQLAIAKPDERRAAECAHAASQSTCAARVHGQVRRAGKPVPMLDLSFVPLSPELLAKEVDWDFSGGDGRYEVRLPPGDYRVCRGEHGEWLADAFVPTGAEEVELDLVLSATSGELR